MPVRYILIVFIWIVSTGTNSALANSRIKDIVDFEGIRENPLAGYGLVVGLSGTGDNLKNSAFTEKGLMDYLEKFGINTSGVKLKTKNVAAVTVTGFLPPFSRQGSKIDVTVSTIGDAKNLEGGTLIATPMLGADGNVYAVAQGQVSIGGFIAGDTAGNTISKGVPTNGFISAGAIVEREINFDLNSMTYVSLALKNPDISTAKRIEHVINMRMNGKIAHANDPGTVTVSIPDRYQNNLVQLLSEIEQLRVRPDTVAKIVIDESSGTIVMGENVRINTVAVAQGNLVVRITQTPLISQPLPFAPISAVTVGAILGDITVEEQENVKLSLVEEQNYGGGNLRELVNALNALGVGPRDLITILQTIKSSGALQAEIVTR